MSAWPATLPQTAFLWTSIADDDSRLTQPMDAGPASVRNRFSAITQSVSVPMILTGAQLATFKTFYRTTLNYGTNSFDWKDPTDDATVTFRFKSPPDWKAISGGLAANRYWQATLALEILP